VVARYSGGVKEKEEEKEKKRRKKEESTRRNFRLTTVGPVLAYRKTGAASTPGEPDTKPRSSKYWNWIP
jgi:hypothetical protein